MAAAPDEPETGGGAGLLLRRGRVAFRINGDAMWQARLTKDFDRYHVLKEVSGGGWPVASSSTSRSLSHMMTGLGDVG